MKRLALLLAASMLLGAASCPPRPPDPQPTPTPEPTPTPTPPPGVPSKGQAVLLPLLIRQDAPRLTRGGEPFTPSGATQCCMGTDITPFSKMPRKPKPIQISGEEVNSRWPSISIPVMEFFSKFGGANFFVIRVAPYLAGPESESEWADIGGPVLEGQWPEFNQAWWDENRKIIWHAGNVLKSNIQVEWDAWYGKTCKNNSQPCSWPESEQQAWGETFTAGHQRFIDKIVEEFGCFGNVVWQVDNEGALVRGAKREYYEAVHWAFRDAEQRLGCGIVHMTGINWPEVGDGPYDYVTTHADAALTQPFWGKHSQNNEHNKPVSVDEDYSRFCTAQEAGLHYWYWRAEDSTADMRAKLSRRKAGCGEQVGCFAPSTDDPLWGSNVTGAGQKKQAVLDAEAAVGERCGSVPPHENGDATLEALASELRRKGECASRNSDSVFILAPDGLWEEYHAVAYTDGCWANNPAVLPKFRWVYRGQNPVPTCTDPDPIPVTQWNVKEHTKGPNKTVVDSTPLVGPDAAYCAAIGFTDGRNRCPVRAEGDPMRSACEAAVVGSPRWSGPGQVSPENVYQYWVPRGVTGTAKVCTAAGDICGSVEVTP